MKVKTLSALAGLGGALILSSEANAAFVNITVVKHTTVVIPAGPQTVDVYRVYANFTNGADYVNGVFGDAANPLSLQNRNATNTALSTVGFFNGGADVTPGVSPYASVTWATFMTVGAWNTSQGVAPIVAPVGWPPDPDGGGPFVAGFISGPSLLTDVNGAAWTIGNDLSVLQGRADFAGDGDAALRVGLMQLSVNVGEHVRGTLNIQVNLAGAPAGTSEIRNLTFDSFPIPAPGALALLGLAGLVGSRRRRA